MKAEKRMKPEWGVTLDGVWIPSSMLGELDEQGKWDSQFGDAYIRPSREQRRVLVARGLAEEETKGGLHRGEALDAFIKAIEFPA